MSVDLDTVKRVARLARIAVTEEEAGRMTGELNVILGFVEQLGEVDVDGASVALSVPEVSEVVADVVVPRFALRDATANGPAGAAIAPLRLTGVEGDNI
ncbi:MAG TPA: Asp-tRNA(Asn)/Glu-tRNA(Gln) amidotransferase subunit GatC, partial [Aquamicrobium sp.]|nr:Asp-tRNA(Asn)/Glu-tRNA(Gln) amidotransferase subunit GatC [Aquamicrobium sp.]